jgi:A/G-specific adenine glycosylase
MTDRKQSFRTAPPLTPPNGERVHEIVEALLAWGTVRVFPWRERVFTPFQMLITESLLTRTRAEMVSQVIKKLCHRFPTANAMADARVDDIGEIIAPLGLKKRAGMLRACAQAVKESHGVPHDRSGLLKLPGVGAYVADAVRVFAFNEPVIPVDAVIGRVLRRVLGYESFGPAYADRALWRIAQRFAMCDEPRSVVAALLDLGALICLPARPRCSVCPLARVCVYGSGLLEVDPAPMSSITE